MGPDMWRGQVSNRVLYGSDTPLKMEQLVPHLEPPAPAPGSGVTTEGSRHPVGSWATTLLPKAPDSVLSPLDNEVPAVTSGLCYLGALGSAFFYHVEDQRLAS